MKTETCLKIAAFAGATGVAAGAFGAHALTGRIPDDLLEIYHTAADYHLLNSVILLALCPLIQHFQMNRMLHLSVHFFWFGALIFSGSLYSLALSGTRWWGAVTPIGGVSLIVGWTLLFFASLTGQKPSTSQHNQS